MYDRLCHAEQPGEVQDLHQLCQCEGGNFVSFNISQFVMFTLQGESALHYISLQPLSEVRGNVSIKPTSQP